MLPPETPKPKYRSVIPENIPEKLKSLPQWGVWRAEKRDGKWIKPPRNPKTGRIASMKKPTHWTDFKTAFNTYEKGQYDGLSFNVMEKNGLVGFDFDHCVNPDTGEIEPEVKQFLEYLQSYAEFSPGDGSRAFAFGTMPGTRNKLPGKGYEIYWKDKPLTVTGHAIYKRPVENRPAECKQVYESIFGVEKPPEPVYQPHPPMMITDTDLLDKMLSAANGGRIQALYNGDIGDHPSHSEADMALCSALAFWTGRDEERMDRLFRSSGLMRDKWNRKTKGSLTYGQITIQNAARNCTNVYDPKPRHQERTPSPKKPLPQKIDPDEWLEPIPIGKSNLPPIQPEMLPPRLRAYVVAKAKQIQVPLEMPLTASLGALSAAAQKKFKVEPHHGYREPVNIYIMTAADPSERKSSTIKDGRAPIVIWEFRKEAEIGHERAIALSKLETAQDDIKAKRKERLKPGITDGKKSELADVIAQLEANLPVVPEIPASLVDDITSESLGVVMNSQNETAAIIEAEGGFLGNIGGRYSGGVPNIQLVLKGFSGDAVGENRISRGKIKMAEPCLTICLMPQPPVVREFGSNQTFVGCGLVPRFFYLFPRSMLGKRTPRGADMPEAIEKNYHRMVTALLDTPFLQDDAGQYLPTILKLSDSAYAIWTAFFNKIEKSLVDGSELAHVKEWGGKIQGGVLRIAALFHLSEYGPNGSPVIDEGIMKQAVQFVAVSIEHSKYAHGFMKSSPSEGLACDILKWIAEKKTKSFTGKECLDRLRGRKLKMEADIIPALEVLQDSLCIREIDPNQVRGRRRRLFAVNPNVYKMKDKLI